MRRGNTLIPAVIVILSMAAFVGVLYFAFWPKANDFEVSQTVVRHKAVKNTNLGNANAVENVNDTANTNTSTAAKLNYEQLMVTNRTEIGEGSVAPYYSWNPAGNRLIIVQSGPATEFGLPGYVTYSVYNLSTKKVLKTDIHGGVFDRVPRWTDDDHFNTAGYTVSVSDSKLSKEALATQVPEGFSDFDRIQKTWKDQVVGEPDHLGSAAGIVYAPDNSYVVYIRGMNATNNVFVWPKNGQSEAAAVKLGDVGYGVESSFPRLVWQGNRYIVSIDTGEAFDVQTKKQVVDNRGGAGYKRRTTVVSLDRVTAAIIDNEQDRVKQGDYSHESFSAYFQNLTSGKTTNIFSGSSPSNTNIWVDWAPDSQHVIYSYNKVLSVATTANSIKQQLTTDNKNYSYVAWSPKGDMIAVTIDDKVWLLELGKKSLDTADWKTYTNKKWGFSFKYPTVLKVTREDDSSSGFLVIVADTRSTTAGGSATTYEVDVRINPDGYGPQFPYKTWTIEKTAHQGFQVINESSGTAGNPNPTRIEIVAAESTALRGNVGYRLNFFNDSGVDRTKWEKELKTLLSTFAFTK